MKPKIAAPLSTVNLALLLLGTAGPSSAQVERFNQFVSEPPDPGTIIYNAPELPPGFGAPSGRRDGGASRGRCGDYSGLAALMPITEGVVWGQTTAAQPTLWFYLPAAVTADTPLKLVVQDADDDSLLHTIPLAVEAEAGSLAIALPPTVELPVNQPHFWTLSLYCDPERPASAVFVQGTIERVTLGAAPFSPEAEYSLSQAQSLAGQGIWYDALTVLGQRLQADATDVDIRRAWTDLLEQVGLPQAGSAPVLSCCTAESPEAESPETESTRVESTK